MNVDVKKYVFIGMREELDEFLKRAQHHGFMEFVSLTGKKPAPLPESGLRYLSAIKILRKLPLLEPYEGPFDKGLAEKSRDYIIELNQEIELLLDEERVLSAEMERVKIFGDFSLSDIHAIEKEGKRKIQFFCMKTAKSHKTNFPPEIIYIGTDFDLDYFISISPEKIAIPSMIEMQIEHPLGELEKMHAEVVQLIAQKEKELKSYAGYIPFLHEAFIEELNIYNLQATRQELTYPLTKSVFVIEAWVPVSKIHSLFALIDGMTIHAEQIAPQPEEKIPTYLENKGAAQVGEDLISIYDVPSITDKDPSIWVLIAFSLFFAMIISDAGYGLIFLATAFFLKFKFPQLKGQAKRFLKLLFILSTCCVVWGVITSSYFGISLSDNNPLKKISFIQLLASRKMEYFQAHGEAVKGDLSNTILLEIALLVGMVHVALGMLRYSGRNLAGLGWIVFMIGGYLYFPSLLDATPMFEYLNILDPATAATWGFQLIFFGIGLACVLSFIQRKWFALLEPMTSIQVFADVLSYLRLYALALAGAMMAETFNSFAEIMGLVAGGIIMFIGHVLNIALGLMGGVIHGLRLNFLEWYHYAFEGGGRHFNPLKKIKS